MSSERPTTEALLLDLHLGRLEGDDRAKIEEQLKNDESTREKSECLGRLLRPLDFWHAGPPPANLVEKVLARVGSRAANNKVAPSKRIFLFPGRYRDVFGAAASIAILISIAIPVTSMVRGKSREVLCAANLESIYEGLSAYQQSHGDFLPFAGHSRGASWLPVSDGGTTFASNSRHPYLLLKHKFGPQAKNFLCPADANTNDAANVSAAADLDFPTAKSITYDSLYLGGETPNVRPPTTLAYMSDANPLFVGARFNDTLDPEKTNSPSHGGKGQSVLSLNGRVQFAKTPIYGAREDNLWVIGGVKKYRGVEAPSRTDDAFLVPGYPGATPPESRN